MAKANEDVAHTRTSASPLDGMLSTMRVLSALKNLIVPSDRRARKIIFGPFKGITMNLSLRDQAQIHLGLFERETHPWLVRLSEGIKTGVDIGAAHGEYTLFFLKKTGAEKILAFEPDSSKWPLLRANLRLNDASDDDSAARRLELSRALVGDADGEGTVTLDSALISRQRPCLIKLDVDGAEAEILRGAKAVNELPGVRWLIETHSATLEKECMDMLRVASFEVRIIRNAWWRFLIPELRPGGHNRWLAAWKQER